MSPHESLVRVTLADDKEKQSSATIKEISAFISAEDGRGTSDSDFAVPAPVNRPGLRSSKRRKRSNSAASRASSTSVEEEYMDFDPEGDPTTKRPREEEAPDAGAAASPRSRSRSSSRGSVRLDERSRSRPYTTGDYIGLAKAKA